MDMQGALRARLTGLAGGRIYWVDRPQTSALPAVTLQIVSDPRPQHLKGFDELRRTLVQIDVWASTYAAATALKEQVLAAVVPPVTANGVRFERGIVESSDDSGEKAGEVFVHRQRIDLGVWWQAA